MVLPLELSNDLSVVFGWCSITCWLGAQFPQLLVNIKNQSVEGLALPFLANWLFGDITNLVGCILTDQLPFQKYLASYFCFVDICLVGQYFYYSNILHPEKQISEGLVVESPLVTSRILSPQIRYRAIHHAASNIAATAAALEHDYSSPGGSRRRAASLSSVPYQARTPRLRRTAPSLTRDLASPTILAGEYDEEAEDEVPGMFESFYSEGGPSRNVPRSSRPPLRVQASVSSASTILSEADPDTAHPSPSGTLRGRALTRQGDIQPPSAYDNSLKVPLPMPEGFEPEEQAEASGSQLIPRRRAISAKSPSWGRSRERSAVSRRSATIVFLGVWTLFGIGGWSNRTPSGAVFSAPDPPLGRVLARDPVPTPIPNAPNPEDLYIIPYSIHFSKKKDPTRPKRPKLPPRPRKLIIGRISAWMCTTLYLTSRLPQIWKNFVRKSVEGLSIALFVFAFLGNTFYVLSILSNPIMAQVGDARTAYIRETIPYLLGSGGTLMFDITIVLQSYVYRGQKPRKLRSGSLSTYGGSSTIRRRTVNFDEEEALLGSTVSESSGVLGRSRSGPRRGYGSAIGQMSASEG